MKRTTKAPTRSAKPAVNAQPLSLQALRWRCDPKSLRFASTDEVEPASSVVGQDDAVEALRYGLATEAPGQNIFVRGLTGTGRLTLVRRLLEDIRPTCPRIKDCCYVHDFSQPERPNLLMFSAGRGVEFRRRIAKLADFIRDDLRAALSSEGIAVRRRAIDEAARRQLKAMVEPLEEALHEAGLTLVNVEAGPVSQTVVFPLVDDKAVPPEEFEQLHATGEITDEHYKTARDNFAGFEQQLNEVNEKATELRHKHGDAISALLEKSARGILDGMVREIRTAFPEPGVEAFLDELVEDVVANRLPEGEEAVDFTRNYHVNVVLEHKGDDACPIVVETAPTMRNLVGTIEHDLGAGGDIAQSHMGIRAGALLRADGGYLILEDREVLREPGAWKALKRTLRTGSLEITLPDGTMPGFAPALKPEPIEINVKVVLIGDPEIYYMLDERDPDFSQLFKVLADFGDVIPRDQTGVDHYATVVARIAKEEDLPAFDRSAIAALAEHGARIAARSGKLTARFGRLADIAREATFIARGENPCDNATGVTVTGDNVRESVRRGRKRASLPSREFREYVADGTIRVETSGTVVGQVNGLAVLQAGPIIYGFPTRVTATIGPGTTGVINIEREAALSGAIHTKGFYILGGLMRHLLRTDHPLAFDASVALEQSYGGIDGDSASGAEICCLLSALTDIPLNQGIAMTGAIDQRGHIMAVGAVNEKIEGFFDACHDIGITGAQGVVIPKANAGDLMLRHDVLESCSRGDFRVYAVETVHEALEILTGKPAGRRAKNGDYPKRSILGLAVQRAHDYWLKAAPPGSSPTTKRRTPPARKTK